MTQPLRYRFEVFYQTKNTRLASDFLEKCDLILGKFAFKELIEFSYSKEEKPVQYFKDLIEQAYNSLDCTVVEIKGGKIE